MRDARSRRYLLSPHDYSRPGADRTPAHQTGGRVENRRRGKGAYKTIFALAWATGLRAGELLGLSVGDLDFKRGIIRPRKQADDRTRTPRELKTRKSKSPVAMTPETVALLTAYLQNHWRDNPYGLLFPNRAGRPRKRANVVRFGLKPVLREFGLPTQGVGLHAFRHGLGTALSNNKVSPKTVQEILRHTDIKTTFRYYVHSDTETQRTALETVSIVQMFQSEQRLAANCFESASSGRGGGGRTHDQRLKRPLLYH